MSTADSGSSLPDPPMVDLDKLPSVRRIEFRRVRYPTPHPVVVGTRVLELTEAGEVAVEFAQDPPVRALAPAVWVGDVQLTEFDRVAEGRYVFIAPEPDRLQRGATVQVGWAGTGTGERVATVGRFDGFSETSR
jgi:hypothetical protein